MENLTGKVAIVTGSSRGIGRGIAERLGQDGATVVVNYSGSEQEAKQVVEAIESKGGKSVAIQASVSKVEDIRRLFAETIRHFGQLDILVNNADIAIGGAIADVTEDDYDKVFNLNVRGVLFALQEAAKHMSNGGRIVNISSTTTIQPEAGMAVYAASKAAIKLFTAVMAREVGDRGITVNTVMPGPTIPGMFGNMPTEVQQQAAASSPFNRVGTPQDIADVVAFLVSEEARWLTGQDICANGGAKM
ncbi:MAG: glucose 1-dehydrogenase [Drouetiella hepatica Uher 2000/2452]|jgi:3-oxoacyl-[acyl-carrier protein] reductase|uniref:Glucose 1-dehydrogenase n=1 Tax=Drouetiella hepatica Uher 2000/2452 TaxID=904376 RepID=A0A951QI27_9CYAN|nr:glucose 1-dehydrogenase [Drouetiella hepatica Uher 2000/2452]